MAKKTEKKASECTTEELKLQYNEASKKLFELRNEFKLNRKLDKPHLLTKYRKDMARALTVINMKKSETKEGS
ncbi:MAG: hypothetical protein S4CHLAM6_06800 [Chlamydiae bacterium]|nr:hypothetical protein [Chlamydiota bacterium]